jgi:hypothetical protein
MLLLLKLTLWAVRSLHRSLRFRHLAELERWSLGTTR